jgi:hypothetical protein
MVLGMAFASPALVLGRTGNSGSECGRAAPHFGEALPAGYRLPPPVDAPSNDAGLSTGAGGAGAGLDTVGGHRALRVGRRGAGRGDPGQGPRRGAAAAPRPAIGRLGLGRDAAAGGRRRPAAPDPQAEGGLRATRRPRARCRRVRVFEPRAGGGPWGRRACGPTRRRPLARGPNAPAGRAAKRRPPPHAQDARHVQALRSGRCAGLAEPEPAAAAPLAPRPGALLRRLRFFPAALPASVAGRLTRRQLAALAACLPRGALAGVELDAAVRGARAPPPALWPWPPKLQPPRSQPASEWLRAHLAGCRRGCLGGRGHSGPRARAALCALLCRCSTLGCALEQTSSM